MTHIKHTLAALACLLLVAPSANAGAPADILPGANQSMITPRLLSDYWDACWICEPSMRYGEYGVYHFRKSFDLAAVPEKFVVNVTADTRYKLYVNGKFASLGPVRCDPLNWNFETVDIAPLLRAGKNVIAAVVWNFGQFNPDAQDTRGYAEFLLQGNTEVEAVVNTDASWLCYRSGAYKAGSRFSARGGYYAAGMAEVLDGEKYPWGWEQPDFDDSAWKKSWKGGRGGTKGALANSGRQLVPSPIPSSSMDDVRFARLCRDGGLDVPAGYPAQSGAITIPANTKVTLLYDRGELMDGYPEVVFSGGKKAEIRLIYAEALYEGKEGYNKGDRNVTEGKDLYGLTDIIVADGGDNRKVSPLWWRALRYMGVEVTTKDEPLTLNDVHAYYSVTPLKRTSTFEAAERPEYSKMLEIGWRTLQLCANETYMDCPYYEQMQYFGDAHVQAMVTLYNSGDDFMLRQLIEQGRRAMTSDGIPSSRYPVTKFQFIPAYTVWLMGITYDYWYMRGDDKFVASMLPSFRSTLAWFESFKGKDGALHNLPYWFFVDWANEYFAGIAPTDSEKSSAYYDMFYLLGLKYTAAMERSLGIKAMADYYDKQAAEVAKTIRSRYWDEARGLFSDTKEHKMFSQQLNTLAVLTDLVEGKEAREVMTRVLDDDKLVKVTPYYQYYVHMCMTKVGLGERLDADLKMWRDMIDINLSTWGETAEPTRSDCHAWCTSPSVDIFRTVLGVWSTAPGFKKVRIAPSPNGLRKFSGSMPHPDGTISASYDVDAQNRITADITLPQGITGVFEWHGKSYKLRPGRQQIKAK